MTTNGPELDLILGVIAAVLANPTKRAAYAWRPDGTPYPAGAAFGFYVDESPETAGNAITVSEYAVADDPSLSDSTAGIQFRIESKNRLLVKQVSADLFDVFAGRWGGKLGVVTLVSASRSSGTNLGQDANGRLGRTENYYLAVHRPSTHRS